MTSFDAPDEEWFEASESAESVAVDSGFESANVCRVAALSTMLGGPSAFTGQAVPALAELGFSAELTIGDRDYRQGDPFADDANTPLSPGGEPDQVRRQRWLTLNETGRPRDMLAFIITVLGSRSDRESAAAAAALWREVVPRITGTARAWHDRWWRYERLFAPWDDELLDLDVRPFPDLFSGSVDPENPDAFEWTEWDPGRWEILFARVTSALGSRYNDPYLIGRLVRWRLQRALRSPDQIVRQLAFAAFQPASSDGDQPPVAAAASRSSAPGGLVVSTMIHGTWGWKGDWWRPRGPFHEFILRAHRPNLFSRGARYSWSGGLSDHQRALAARDFHDWSYDVAPHGIQTLFSHSYGGEVAARAITLGANVHELVLLSAPVTSHVQQVISSSVRIVDVRLRFDPVLWLAGAWRCLPAHPNVTPVVFSHWNLDHGGTHDERAWQVEDVARRGQL